jgi:hypothetical protein
MGLQMLIGIFNIQSVYCARIVVYTCQGMARVAPEKAEFAPALPISLRAATCEVV